MPKYIRGWKCPSEINWGNSLTLPVQDHSRRDACAPSPVLSLAGFVLSACFLKACRFGPCAVIPLAGQGSYLRAGNPGREELEQLQNAWMLQHLTYGQWATQSEEVLSTEARSFSEAAAPKSASLKSLETPVLSHSQVTLAASTRQV